MKRALTIEMMDSPAVDPTELATSLDDLRQVGRWLGGRRTAVAEVLRLARRVGRARVTVLDLGTGGADVPIALLDAADRQGLDIRVTATDAHPATVRLARMCATAEPRIEVQLADALDLGFGDGAFDIVMCNTTLHHFGNADAVRVLREMRRVARVGIVVTDLERSTPALIGVQLLAATVWRDHPITRHDGPASVRAAFTRSELDDLAVQAGLSARRTRRTPVFRLCLTSTVEGR